MQLLTETITKTNQSLENAVNNRIEKESGKEGAFKAESLPWGKWDIVNKTISHKGEMYLRYYSTKNGKVEVAYFENGKPISESSLATLKAYKAKCADKSAKQADAGLTDNQVITKCVKMSKITYLAINGETYEREEREVA